MWYKLLAIALIITVTTGIGGYLRSQQEQQGDYRYERYVGCITTKAQYCNSIVCITSEVRDCQDRCYRLAVESCGAGDPKQGIRLPPRLNYPWLR